jgi:putative hydrolase of the HAD superfamily
VISTIIFDLNRVLVDDDFFYKKLPKFDVLLRKELGISTDVFINHYRKYAPYMGTGVLKEDEFWNMVLSDAGAKKNVRFCKRFIRDIVYKKEGIMPVLRILKNMGYKLVVLAGDSDYFAEHKLNNFGFDKVFDHVFTSAQYGLSKSDERIYENVVKDLEVSPEECVFVDDKISHLVPAEMVGLQGVWFTNVKKLLIDLEHKGIKL